MTIKKKLSHSWWFDSQNRSDITNQSPWLTLTLSELEEKTKQMLELIEDDADSFAQRAEMYYKKRPQLVNMIEDFYRAHRSMAEQYDQLKLGGGVRRSTSFSPSKSIGSCSLSVSNSDTDEAPKISLDSFYSDESEVDDPEQEDDFGAESKLTEVPDEKTDSHTVNLEQELARLKEENATLKSELAQKDEDKREVIRQLAMSLDMLKDENVTLRKCLKNSNKKGGVFGFKKLTKDMFSGKLFGGQWKSQTTIIAL